MPANSRWDLIQAFKGLILNLWRGIRSEQISVDQHTGSETHAPRNAGIVQTGPDRSAMNSVKQIFFQSSERKLT